jgi:DNA-3-methyladenine glycosylase II
MKPRPQTRRARGVTTQTIHVQPPYRLDLTVTALRRTVTNVVDVYTPDGRYLRALDGPTGTVIVSVTQPRRDALVVTVRGSPIEAASAVARVRRILGTERDVSSFHRHARAVAWLAPLARRLRGIRPPRYPSLFEACANSILFQQVSLPAAGSIMRRMLLALGSEVEHDGVPLVVFPSAESFLGARNTLLRAAGLSSNKVATLRRAAEAIVSGALSEALLEEHSSEEAAVRLQAIKGIGPWTAAVILLRGLGRVDVFPGKDTGVAANATFVAGRPVNVERLVERLGPQRGMLYFCLLLARLDARGEIGRASDVASGPSQRRPPHR